MEQLDHELNRALNLLRKNHEELTENINNQQNPDIKEFMLRVMEWRGDKRRSSWLYQLLHEVVDMSDLGFMGSFNSFCINCLEDDSSYRVEYRAVVCDRTGNLVWDRGTFKTELSDASNPLADPVVVYDNDGTQMVTPLMDAMDHLECQWKYRLEQEELKTSLLDRLHGRSK